MTTPAARTDKRMTLDEVVDQLSDGMTIGLGGWGSRRKPMALVRAILRSSLRDLTIVSFGGADVGLLCESGQARRVVYGFVTLDSIPIEPHFARARQSGAIEVEEYDEGMLVAGLKAASQRLPFLPTRAGLGSSVMVNNPHLRLVSSPYSDGEQLVAMPAIHLDAALVHLNRADVFGNAQYLGLDPYFDDLLCMAAETAYVSVEQIVETAELTNGQPIQSLLLNRSMVNGVVEAPLGARFTACEPDYARLERVQSAYVAAATAGGDEWASFKNTHFLADDADVYAAMDALENEGR